MMNALKALLDTWFCQGKCQFFSNDNGAMEYFRAEFKKNAKHAYDYWQSTGKMNYQS